MKHTFADIRCGGTTRKAVECTSYLGHVQTDLPIPHTSFFYCQRCNRTLRVEVIDGVIHETPTKQLITTPQFPLRVRHG